MQIQFAEVDGIDLPESKRFALSDGVLLLTRQNDDLLTNGELGSVTYQLYYDETQELPVYTDELDLPIESFDFVDRIIHELKSDGEPLSADIQLFLSTLSQEVETKPKRKGKRPSARIERTADSVTPPQEAAQEPIKENPSIETEQVASVSTTKALEVEKSSEKIVKEKADMLEIRPYNRRVLIKIRRKHLAWLGVFFVALFLAVAGFKYFSATSAQEKPTYSELMKKEYYLEAGKEYPEKQAAIEQVLYDKTVDSKNKKTKETLIQFQKVYPTPFGTFDLAILESDYGKALKEYEREKEDFKGNQDRLVLVGYCYLKTDQLAEAKTIVDETKSTELERYVYKYEQKQDEIKSLEKTLTDLRKNPVDNKDEIEKTMNALFDAKEELLNL